MHAFAVDHGGYDRYELRHWDSTHDGKMTAIFEVSGPREPYEARLEQVETIETYEISEGADDRFALYVRENPEETDERLSEAFSQGSLVVLPPVEYRMDRTIGVRVVGQAEHVKAAVETAPPTVSVTVDHVGPYRAGLLPGGVTLTDRQRAAVEAAVAEGYYAPTRDGSVAAVAEQLDCSTGTAAEHLRKAEATVMQRLVE
jgi:hypothetical protein